MYPICASPSGHAGRSPSRDATCLANKGQIFWLFVIFYFFISKIDANQIDIVRVRTVREGLQKK